MTSKIHSLQLYTLRKYLNEDIAGTLAKVADAGYTTVELYRLEQYRAQYREALQATGLRALSAHGSLLTGDLSGLLAAASDLGVKTLIDPRIPQDQWTTRESIEAAAARFNEVARIARDAGIQVGYHNHHEEMAQIDGRTGLEVFADALDDDVVLEVDVFWAEVGGVSAPDLLRRLGQRVQLLHVKDGPRSHDLLTQQPLGQGDIPITEVLAAAPDTIRLVEFDDYDGDLLDAVTKSLRYLEEVDL